jgi:branched-chain amino acid transport system permease protein
LLTLQFLTTGLLTGGIYALIAVSIVLVYKSTRIFNFAVGELMVLGGLVCYSFVVWFHLPLWLALLGALGMAVVVGLLVERLAFRPLLGQPILTIIMATLALSSILGGVMLMVWTGYTLTFPPGLLPGKTILVGTIAISHELLWAFAITMVALVILVYFFMRTSIGLRMRAVSEDHNLSMSCGVNITVMFALTWIIAALLGSLSGLLLGNRLGLTAAQTPAIALKAFPAVIFGGLESIVGAVVGGLAVGVIEAIVGGLIDPKLGEISAYILLLIVLIFKPEGLFGQKRIERI